MTREDLDGEIQRQMCLSVPQCNRTAFPCLPFTQNMHQGHRIRAATGRAKIVHYHGLKVSRKREVAKSFCDLGARPEIIVCQAVVDEMCQCSFPLTNTMIPQLVFFTQHWLVFHCPFRKRCSERELRELQQTLRRCAKLTSLPSREYSNIC